MIEKGKTSQEKKDNSKERLHRREKSDRENKGLAKKQRYLSKIIHTD